ncbi:EAL domain-containing protein [Eubacteriaceae bacterium ES3]|nr:EAL domain-containing protein [Eubacteriaceae bacterium ES3]
MKEITRNLKDQYQTIRANTIHQVFILAIIIITLTFFPAILLSIYPLSYKLLLLGVNVGTALISTLGLVIIKKKISDQSLRLRIYLIISLIYIIMLTILPTEKYLTTNGLAVYTMTVVIFLSLNKRYLYIAGFLTLGFITYYGILGVGQFVALGLGYLFSNFGMYLLMLITLVKGIDMYAQFEELYQLQLLKMNDLHLSLRHLNEEIISTDQELKHSLIHDSLTGALNWRGFADALEQRIAVDKNTDFYVVLFDLDNFMYINNSFGYNTGDQIIIKLVNQLMSKHDLFEYVSRSDGDTLMFIVNHSIAKKVVLCQLEQIFKSIKIGEMEFRIKASIGISEAYENARTIDLIRNAEMAMHKVKDEGKGNYADHDDAYIQMIDRQYKISSIMSEAIEKGEFYNLYQPKVGLNNNSVDGFEALVRWNSQELGTIYPDEFIRVAEQSGQIIELGQVIMKNAMIFAKNASQIDASIVVSINISARQLLEESFLVRTQKTIKDTDVAVNNIAFEITETAYIENLDNAKRVMERIKGLGIPIYLDDFGTGYSSLSYLHKLPIDVLKIDKSFVDTIGNSEQSRELLVSVIMLAKSLKLSSCAEGVETFEQLKILKGYGCEYVQGYYFDKPLAEDEAIKRLGFKY